MSISAYSEVDVVVDVEVEVEVDDIIGGSSSSDTVDLKET